MLCVAERTELQCQDQYCMRAITARQPCAIVFCDYCQDSRCTCIDCQYNNEFYAGEVMVEQLHSHDYRGVPWDDLYGWKLNVCDECLWDMIL